MTAREWLWGSVLVGALMAMSLKASAAELRWEAPEECDRRSYVVERVEELVGRSFASVDGLKFAIRARALEDGTWDLELVTDAGDGPPRSRRFVDQTCSGVLDAAAVAVAMTIRDAAEAPRAQGQKNGQHEQLPPEPPALVPGVAADPSRERAAAPRQTASASSPGLIPELSAGFVVHGALFPGPSFGGAVGFGLRRSSLRLTAEVTLVPASTVDVDGGHSADFEFLAGAALACFDPGGGSLGVFACGGYEVGRLSAEGRSVSEPHLRNVLWQALRLEVGATLALTSRLRLSAGVGVALPVARAEFVLDERSVHRTGTTLRGQIGLGMAL